MVGRFGPPIPIPLTVSSIISPSYKYFLLSLSRSNQKLPQKHGPQQGRQQRKPRHNGEGRGSAANGTEENSSGARSAPAQQQPLPVASGPAAERASPYNSGERAKPASNHRHRGREGGATVTFNRAPLLRLGGAADEAAGSLRSPKRRRQRRSRENRCATGCASLLAPPPNKRGQRRSRKRSSDTIDSLKKTMSESFARWRNCKRQGVRVFPSREIRRRLPKRPKNRSVFL